MASTPAMPTTTATTGTSTGAAPATGMPDPQEMMKQMMELAKTNENHKILADLAGNWTYKIKFMNPATGKWEESGGTAVRKNLMDGRYSVLDVTGKMQMPGADGKMKEMTFKGQGVDGYDNVKKKFVSAWVDNMGTGIMMSEGTYNPTSKSVTYNTEVEMAPGMKQKVREVIKLTDKDHHVLEWYEDRGGQDTKTMEIAYTRSGKGK